MLALVKRCGSLLQGIVALLLPTAAQASAPCTPGLTEGFRFHASAPIVEARVSPKGNVALTSLDGYVHALGPNGRFAWSYTLDSAPGAVDIDRDGRVYALSSKGILHVLRPNGERTWGGQLPSGMNPTGQVVHSERGWVFVPSNLNVYAFSDGSGLSWRAFIGGTVVSGPVLGPDGDVWVIAENGEVHRVRTPSQRSKFALPSSDGAQLVAVTRDEVFIVNADGLSAYAISDASKRTASLKWAVPGVEQVTADVRVIRSGSKWVWLDTEGQPIGERELELEVSAQPAHVAGRVYAPGANGRLYVFGRQGRVEWCQVAHAPLLVPQVDTTGGALVASGDGWLVSVQLRRGVSPNERRGAQ